MRILLCYLLILCWLLAGCRKDWLEAKPQQNLVVPTSLDDLQALLDNTSSVFNQGVPALGLISSDDYYVTTETWQSLYSITEKNAYLWAKDLYGGTVSVPDWMLPFQQVFYCNYILQTLDQRAADSASQVQRDNIRGSALFCRAFAWYGLVTCFAPVYDPATAPTDPGLPLRLTADINSHVTRASVEDSYRQIVSDLETALPLLPVQPAFKTRPSKPAVAALLARVYLDREEYAESLRYADSCLQWQGELIDYNTVDATAAYPFPYFNEEVIYHSVFNYPAIVADYNAVVDSVLYASYDPDDLRQVVLVDTGSGAPRFKGGYDGYTVFAGLAVDEVWLLHAEAAIRLGDRAKAAEDFQKLLGKRYRTGTYTAPAFTDPADWLRYLFAERRRELLFRGLRFNDLRRMNRDPALAVTLHRVIDGVDHTLPPGDPRYVMPIPQQEINTSGITQNPR